MQNREYDLIAFDKLVRFGLKGWSRSRSETDVGTIMIVCYVQVTL